MGSTMLNHPQRRDLCVAFNGGGKNWEAIDFLRRVEEHIWDAACEMRGPSPEATAILDAFDIIHRLRCEFEMP